MIYWLLNAQPLHTQLSATATFCRYATARSKNNFDSSE